MQYLHLLEAQVDISNPGIYDSICKSTLAEKAAAVRAAMAHDFNLNSIPYYIDDEDSRGLPKEHDSDHTYEDGIEKIIRKGVAIEDVEFLLNVLNPDPEERWTAADIVSCGYLEVDLN